MEPVRGARRRVENAPGRFSSGSGVFSQTYVTQTFPSLCACRISSF